jgi:hypothetical protein
MNRVIKFRAKRLDETPKSGEWVFGDLAHKIRITAEKDINIIRVEGYDIDENTIGQFTGLHDKNGEEVYEGDILSFPGVDNPKAYYVSVEWDEYGNGFLCRYDVYNHKYGFFSSSYNLEGNIHDNPELLTTNKK